MSDNVQTGPNLQTYLQWAEARKRHASFCTGRSRCSAPPDPVVLAKAQELIGAAVRRETDRIQGLVDDLLALVRDPERMPGELAGRPRTTRPGNGESAVNGPNAEAHGRAVARTVQPLVGASGLEEK